MLAHQLSSIHRSRGEAVALDLTGCPASESLFFLFVLLSIQYNVYDSCYQCSKVYDIL